MHPVAFELSGLNTASGPVLPSGHEYDYVMVAPGNMRGLVLVGTYDAPLSSGKAVSFDVVPGSVVPVGGGRALYLTYQWRGADGGTINVLTTTSVVLWLFKSGEPLSFAGQDALRFGDVLARFDYSEVGEGDAMPISVGSSSIVIQASDLARAQGLPLTLRGTMAGGGFDESGTATDYPLELVLRETDDLGTHTYRVLLFPGLSGSARFVLPLGLNVGAGSDWRLYIVNPTGGAAAKTPMLIGEVLYGHFEEDWSYQLSEVRTGISVQNYRQGVGLTVRYLLKDSIRVRVQNNASAGVWTQDLYRYIPSVFGGPNLLSAGTAAPAAGGGNGSIGTNTDGPWYVARGRYTTAPTAGAFAFSML